MGKTRKPNKKQYKQPVRKYSTTYALPTSKKRKKQEQNKSHIHIVANAISQ